MINAQPCKRCGRLFNYLTGDKICPRCKEEMEEKFREVKKYIQEHNHCDIQEVVRECDVQATWIQKWLREERLEFTEGSAITLNCERCGAAIRSGRLCPKCSDQLRSAAGDYLRSGRPSEEESPAHREKVARMRYLQEPGEH